jgi:hypothetical protein
MFAAGATLTPETAVVVLTMSESADIARAVRAAARSEAVFGPRIADRVLAFFDSSRAAASRADAVALARDAGLGPAPRG